MPLLEAAEAAPQGATAEAVALLPLESELMSNLGGEVTQGFEYTRRDGTVEHAANREEAIKLCPVLGELAMEDPDAADLLLDVATIGRAILAEKTLRSAPEKTKRIDAGTKSAERTKSGDQTNPTRAQIADTTIRAEVTAVTNVAHLQRHSQNSVRINDQHASEVIPEQSKPKVSKLESLVPAQVDPAQHLLERRSDPLSHYTEVNRQTHERQKQETTQVITSIDAAPTITRSRPAATRTSSQNFANKVSVAEPALKIEERRPVTGLKQVSHTLMDVDAGILRDDESADIDERKLAIEPVAEWIDGQSAIDLLVADAMLDVSPAEVACQGAELADDKSDAAVAAQIIEQIEFILWADVADKEPLQIYEDFNETLQLIVSFGKLAESELERTHVTIGESKHTNAAETREAQLYPVIAETVAERLAELNGKDREEVAVALTDIVETLYVMEVLEAEEVGPEIIVTMQVELEDKIATLFRQLDIDYVAVDVEEFSAMLLAAASRPSQHAAEIAAADLERDGTHEAKLSFSRQIVNFSNKEDKTQHLLGKLILFYFLLAKHTIPRGALSN